MTGLEASPALQAYDYIDCIWIDCNFSLQHLFLYTLQLDVVEELGMFGPSLQLLSLASLFLAIQVSH